MKSLRSLLEGGLRLGLGLVAAVVVRDNAASPFEQLHRRLTLGLDECLLYAQGQFWLAAEINGRGTIYSSPDGREWTPRAAPFFNPPALAYTNGRFLSFTNSGNYTPMISRDGRQWSTDWSVTLPGPVTAVAGGGGRFVAVGNGKMLWSEDGLAWQAARTDDRAFISVQYVNGLFVAAGPRSRFLAEALAAGEQLGFSENGEDWSFATLPGTATPQLYRAKAAHGNGVYVYAASEVYTFASTNEIAQPAEAPDLVDVIFTDRFIGAGLGGIYESTDGMSWRQVSAYPGTSLAFGDGQYVSYWTAGVLTSADGSNWTPRLLTGHELTGLAFGHGRFVAPASSQPLPTNASSVLISSETGQHWSVVDPRPTEYIGAFGFWQGEFIGLQDGGKGIASRNGLSWEQFETGIEGRPAGLACENGSYLAVGGMNRSNGFIARSTNGREWTTLARFPAYDLRGCALNGSMAVAAGIEETQPFRGLSGIILVSADGGSNWKEIPVERMLYDIICAAGRYIAVGASGAIYVSDDSVNWTSHTLGRADLHTIAYGPGGFVIAGEMIARNSPQFPIWSSTDGVRWQAHNTFRMAGYLKHAAFGANRWTFAGLGPGGSIHQTGPILPEFSVMGPGADSRLRMILHNPTTNDLMIQTSTDLVHWAPLTNTAAQELSFDADVTGRATMFRAVSK